MPTNGYATVAEVKAWIGIGDSANDSQIDDIVTAVSRWIDSHCSRKFWLDPAAVERTFPAIDSFGVAVPDIGSTSGLIVKTDVAGDGTFETTWAASDYQLTPVDAAYAIPEAQPWTGFDAVGTLTFPVAPYGALARHSRVSVTAKWGWPAVPAAVKQACIQQSARVFKRRTSPEGVAGFGEFGVVRISSRLDPDVEALLDPYRRGPSVYAAGGRRH